MTKLYPTTITLRDLKQIEADLINFCDLDLNYSSIGVVLEKPEEALDKYPYRKGSIDDREGALRALRIVKKLRMTINSLEGLRDKQHSTASIPVDLMELEP